MLAQPLRIWLVGARMGSKNYFSKVVLSTLFVGALLAVGIQAGFQAGNGASSEHIAFRIENFVRGLETSGIDGLSHVYQFRGRNLARGECSENGHPATQYHLSVTSS